MSRFNKQTKPFQPDTVNQAGGQAFSQTPELELISLLLTSFAQDQFYEKADDKFTRVRDLLKKVDPLFAAKAAVYARNQFGMRSITHVLASELAPYLSGHTYASYFYYHIVHRLDDMTEIAAYHKAAGRKFTHGMKKGFARKLEQADAYSLAKYRGDGKGVKLVDVVNQVHPMATSALTDLIKGTLKSFDTWESELSKAGQLAANDQEKAYSKAQVWTKLIKERKIGYFALLRNLRNIMQQAPEAYMQALNMLIDPDQVKKSLVLPFRFITALKEFEKIGSSEARTGIAYLSRALDQAVSNVPTFEGRTLIVLDVSGSMVSWQASTSTSTAAEIGALFASILSRANPGADTMVFATNAHYVSLNPVDSIRTVSKAIPFKGGGTNFPSLFIRANKKYDRIIIISDMQGWGSHHLPSFYFSDYRKKYNADPYLFSIDLTGNGTMQFPENRVCAIAGFSEKIFDIMKLVEEDPRALINQINNIVL